VVNLETFQMYVRGRSGGNFWASSELNWLNGGQRQSACEIAVRTPASRQSVMASLFLNVMSEETLWGPSPASHILGSASTLASQTTPQIPSEPEQSASMKAICASIFVAPCLPTEVLPQWNPCRQNPAQNYKSIREEYLIRAKYPAGKRTRKQARTRARP